MQGTRVKALAGAVLVTILALFTIGGGDTDTPSVDAEPQLVRQPVVGSALFIDFDEQAAIEDDARAVAAYLAAVEAERLAVAAYLDGLWRAELDRQAAAARAMPTTNYHPGSTVGECSGFAIPDYIIQRESGGNPSAYNPSGAYGCAQTLLSHYATIYDAEGNVIGGNTCRGLDPYSIDGQRECVWRLSNGGTNLAPWEATR